MSDPHHLWNKGKSILCTKRPCGCHVTKKKIVLCDWAIEYKLGADTQYRRYLQRRHEACAGDFLRTVWMCYTSCRAIYLDHLTTGSVWFKGRLEEVLQEIQLWKDGGIRHCNQCDEIIPPEVPDYQNQVQCTSCKKAHKKGKQHEDTKTH